LAILVEITSLEKEAWTTKSLPLKSSLGSDPGRHNGESGRRPNPGFPTFRPDSPKIADRWGLRVGTDEKRPKNREQTRQHPNRLGLFSA